MSDDFGIAFLGFFESRKMSLGNDQHMRGCLRIDVFEREHVRVFMNLLGGDLSANNAAEKAAGAGIAHGAQFLTDRECGQEAPARRRIPRASQAANPDAPETRRLRMFWSPLQAFGPVHDHPQARARESTNPRQGWQNARLLRCGSGG
jgi:hypothetical protein